MTRDEQSELIEILPVVSIPTERVIQWIESLAAATNSGDRFDVARVAVEMEIALNLQLSSRQRRAGSDHETTATPTDPPE